jgi:drug/metabolite transporter (DMT)-like permease
MLCGSLAFALMGTLTHALGSVCDWRLIALARTSLALLFAAGLARAAGARLVFWRPRTLWIRSIAGSVSLVGTFFALTRLPVADVLTLTNLFPVWVALLSWPLLKEPPAASTWLAVGLSLAGVFLIQRPHLAENNLATGIAVICSFSTAVAMIGLHRLQGIDTPAIVVHFSFVSLLFCLAAWFVFDRPAQPLQMGEGHPFLMLLGVGVTATIGQLFLTKAFAAGAPAKVAVVGLTQIVFAVLLDLWIWQRSFQPETLLGMALVMVPSSWLMTQRPG